MNIHNMMIGVLLEKKLTDKRLTQNMHKTINTVIKYLHDHEQDTITDAIVSACIPGKLDILNVFYPESEWLQDLYKLDYERESRFTSYSRYRYLSVQLHTELNKRINRLCRDYEDQRIKE